MNKEVFTNMGKGQKAMILKEAHDTGDPITKIVSKYTLPDMAIIGSDGKFDYKGNRITPDEWKAINPLGEYGKLVTINTSANKTKNKVI
jgi:hypothetical protein